MFDAILQLVCMVREGRSATATAQDALIVCHTLSILLEMSAGPRHPVMEKPKKHRMNSSQNIVYPLNFELLIRWCIHPNFDSAF
uniref:Uncharacterized protein n=1 Tax=Manihot esculenta TaxID=3983 RepID=A0A2C9U1G0_MANES